MKNTHFGRRHLGRLRLTPLSVVTSALLVAACGGSPPPPPAPVAAPPKPVATADAVDVSAVQEPADLVVTAHLTKPSQDVSVVGGWTNLPMPGADDVADIVTDLDVGALIDLDAPIDVAVAVQGHGEHIKPVYAIALGVRAGAAPGSLPHVKSSSIGGGIFKLQPRALPRADNGDSSDDDDDSGSKSCQVIPSFGTSAMRLVCGSSDAAVTELGPYLARTATRATFNSDLHVEAKLDPLRSTIEQARMAIPMLVGGLINQPGTAGAHDLVNAVLGDLVDASLDLDRVKLDATLTDPAASAKLTVSFRDTHSLVAHLAVAHPERADAPPATFWHLPSDSKGAFFGRGIDSKDLDHPRELLVDAIAKTLDAQGMAAPDRAAVSDVVQQTVALLSTPMVSASGNDPSAAPSDAAKKDDKKKGDRADREERRDAASRGAWALLGVEAPIAKVATIGKSVSATMHRPAVAKLLKEAMPDGVPAPALAVAPVSAKLGLPKDTIHFTLTVVQASDDQPVAELSGPVGIKGGGKGKPAKAPVAAKPKVKLDKPYVLHFYFAPDAGRTWIGYGADETVVANHIKLAMSTSADPSTLTSRAGLDDLKNAKVGSGGFITMRGVLAPSPLEPILHTHDRDMARVLGRLGNAPQKGDTPIPILSRAIAPAGEGAGALEISVKLPRECVRDMVAAAIGR
jgi:hypothetical protein